MARIIATALEQAELTYVVTSPALKEVSAYVAIFQALVVPRHLNSRSLVNRATMRARYGDRLRPA